jgi:hypothetical protein
MEDHFWWFVAFTYIGLVIQTVHSLTDNAIGRGKYLSGLFFVSVIALFTFKGVVGTTYFESTSQWTEGNYTPGTDVHGINWQDGWSELQFSIANNSNYDLKDFDLEFLVDEGVEAITKVNDVGCTVVQSGPRVIDVTVKSQNGQQQLMNSLGYLGPYRMLSDKVPAHTGISLIIALGNIAALQKSLLTQPKQLPSGIGANFLGPKRMPAWVRYYAK